MRARVSSASCGLPQSLSAWGAEILAAGQAMSFDLEGEQWSPAAPLRFTNLIGFNTPKMEMKSVSKGLKSLMPKSRNRRSRRAILLNPKVLK